MKLNGLIPMCAFFFACAITRFSLKQRDVATTICAMLNPVGIALGQILPSIVTSMPSLLLSQAAAASVVWVIVLLCFKDRPKTAPSRTQDEHLMGVAREVSRQSDFTKFRKDVGALVRNSNYVLLMSAFGLGLGLFNALTTLIFSFVQPCGYSEDDASLFGGLIIGCGLLGCAIIGPVLDCTHWYNPLLKLSFVAALASSVFWWSMLRADSLVPVGVGFGLMGASMLPLLPLALECAVECTFPIPEDSSSGLLMMMGQYTVQYVLF